MSTLLQKVRRGWWLFHSSQFTFSEYFTIVLGRIAVNKITYLASQVYHSVRSRVCLGDWQAIYGYKKFLPSGIQPRRALVAYLTEAFYKQQYRGPVQFQFSNNGTPLCLAKALNEAGYIVDVIGHKRKDFKVSKHYDLLVFHDYNNYDYLTKQLPAGTPAIVFDTTAYWRGMNEKIDGRLAYFKERTGVSLPPERFNHFNWMKAISGEIDRVAHAASGIITIGDQRVKTFDSLPNVYKTTNGIYLDPHMVDKSAQRLDKNRKNFLFFGGGTDNIRKGLDLLFEAFIGTDLQLYVCAIIAPELRKTYSLDRHPNIHEVGYVKLGAKSFYNLYQECAFVIQPSCAEGIPGGVLDSIQYGMIPLVSMECNMPTEGFGMTFAENTVPEIRRTILESSTQPAEWLAAHAAAARQAAQQVFTPEHFTADIRNAIVAITKGK